MSQAITRERVFAALDRYVENGLDKDRGGDLDTSRRSIYDDPEVAVICELTRYNVNFCGLNRDEFRSVSAHVRDWQRDRRPK